MIDLLIKITVYISYNNKHLFIHLWGYSFTENYMRYI